MKIEKLGITGNLLKWIKDFLTNRQQSVLINGMSSEWNEVSSGVPQGSVLGPLLFILCVKDLPSEVSSFCKLFADDAKLFKDLQNLEDFEMIQHDIDKLCQSTIKWLMLFIVNKCKILHIGKENPNFDYEMEDKDGSITNLTVVNCEKDLGIYVQDNLKFDQHISKTVNRADRLVGQIKCNVSLLANKPRRWKSMLTHQGWFNLLIYATFTLTTNYRVRNLPIFLYPTPRRHITSSSEKSRPATWPGKHMGKATPVWQLTLSHRCHQM